MASREGTGAERGPAPEAAGAGPGEGLQRTLELVVSSLERQALAQRDASEKQQDCLDRLARLEAALEAIGSRLNIAARPDDTSGSTRDLDVECELKHEVKPLLPMDAPQTAGAGTSVASGNGGGGEGEGGEGGGGGGGGGGAPLKASQMQHDWGHHAAIDFDQKEFVTQDPLYRLGTTL